MLFIFYIIAGGSVCQSYHYLKLFQKLTGREFRHIGQLFYAVTVILVHSSLPNAPELRRRSSLLWYAFYCCISTNWLAIRAVSPVASSELLASTHFVVLPTYVVPRTAHALAANVKPSSSSGESLARRISSSCRCSSGRRELT